MEPRPITVSIIGWWQVVHAVVGTAFIAGIVFSPRFAAIMLAPGYGLLELTITGALTALASFASGDALLRGRAWGRTLYFAYMPAHFIYFMLAHGTPVVSSIVEYGVFVYLLTRPDAKAFLGRERI